MGHAGSLPDQVSGSNYVFYTLAAT